MTDTPPAHVTGDTRRAISRSVVTLLKEHLGRGPLKAKTYVHEDSVVILMYEGHTVGEETLSDGGQGIAVARQRVRSSEAIRERLTAVVEVETRRKVIGYMSSSQQEPSLLCYVFVLDSTDLLQLD
jgi:uncharacterized protein YbcI